MKALAVAVIPWLLTFGGHAEAQTTSKTASIAGLEAKFVDVNALGGTIKTRYYEEGQGEPILLLHGGGLGGGNVNSANMWSRNIPGLSERFRVFAVDKLAAGMTGNPPEDKDYNIQGEVEHIYEFIQTMNLGQVHVVGQSRGGALTLWLAVAHPEVVKTAVLIDPAPPVIYEGVSSSTRASMMEPCSRGDRAWKMRCEMEVLSYAPKIAPTWEDEYYAAGVYMSGLAKWQEGQAKMAAGAGQPLRSQWTEARIQLRERLLAEAVLPMPVLLYHGYNDPQDTRERGLALYEILAAQHANVRLLWTNRTGHFHFREYPEQFNHNLMNFIDYWNGQPTGTTAMP